MMLERNQSVKKCFRLVMVVMAVVVISFLHYFMLLLTNYQQQLQQWMEETIEGLGSIQLLGARQFELYGALHIYGGANKQRTLFLLSDYILVCTKQKLVCGCCG